MLQTQFVFLNSDDIIPRLSTSFHSWLAKHLNTDNLCQSSFCSINTTALQSGVIGIAHTRKKMRLRMWDDHVCQCSCVQSRDAEYHEGRNSCRNLSKVVVKISKVYWTQLSRTCFETLLYDMSQKLFQRFLKCNCIQTDASSNSDRNSGELEDTQNLFPSS